MQDLTNSGSVNIDKFASNLTSVEADRLIWLGGLELGGSADLTMISMPSLETIGTLNIGSNSGLSIRFPQLESCFEIEIFGGYKRQALVRYVEVKVAKTI